MESESNTNKNIPTDNNAQKLNTFALLGFILSFVIGIVGLILCLIAIKQIHKTGEKGKELAIAGLVLSILGTLLLLFGFLIYGLAYFGVLTPEGFLPSEQNVSKSPILEQIQKECSVTGKFACAGHTIAPSGDIFMTFVHAYPKTIKNAKFSINGSCDMVPNWRDDSSTSGWEKGQLVGFTCAIPPGKPGEAFSGEFEIQYVFNGETEWNSERGSINAKYMDIPINNETTARESSCTVGDGFNCKSIANGKGGFIRLYVDNMLGFTVDSATVQIDSDCNITITNWVYKGEREIRCTYSTLEPGTELNKEFEITYYDKDEKREKTVIGNFFTTIY